ncbi:hypothetical protein EHQ52_18510 [Leptospira koniambonensis]|uniref:Uncharacterized protein n=1 Tax=Leptospira koniambonensis TaxID=2484950 RepID=A0A4R9J427_9LEPT|nr:hypothetical protein [Leptospira koniambonensis]TGL28262.1 hypothetical protein EHQ52_18510 [Leptospira koniambonensis]
MFHLSFYGSVLFRGLLLIILLQFSCITRGESSLSAKRSPEIPPTVTQGKVFLAGHTGEHSKDTEEILKLVQRLVSGTISKDLNFLPEIVSKKDGIYLDIKGNWTREQLIQELSKSDNYFRIYFFDRDLLEKQKNSTDVRTVRDLFLSSGGIEVDFYYESKSACELKLKFKENQKLERELINPYFIKQDGKWYLFRLF